MRTKLIGFSVNSAALFAVLILAIVSVGIVPTDAYAFETCEEACPAQDEPGKISFLNGVSTEINCCCVQEIEEQPPVSHPLEDCDIPPP